jgi:hypothetical protein
MAVKTFHHKDLEKKRTATVATLLSLAAAAAASFFSPHACFSVALGARSLC